MQRYYFYTISPNLYELFSPNQHRILPVSLSTETNSRQSRKRLENDSKTRRRKEQSRSRVEAEKEQRTHRVRRRPRLLRHILCGAIKVDLNFLQKNSGSV